MGEGITIAHQQYVPKDMNRDGTDFFYSQLFVDDAIFIEPHLGKRQQLVITSWEYVCRRLLGDSAINNKKRDEEGMWQTQHILLGFEVDVNKLTIRVPTAKRADALERVNQPMFRPGNRIITVKAVQELRGSINHWRYANRFWHFMASPINALLAFADSSGAWIRCDNDQVWITFWNLMKLIQSMSEDDEDWIKLFQGPLDQVISLPKRVGCPRGRGMVVWATGDAVLTQIGAINWDTHEYILEDTRRYLNEVNPPHRRIVISDAEQLVATGIIIAWAKPGKILLLGTDNRNVLTWTAKGYAKKGAALRLTQETSKWIALRNLRVEGFYLRSGHNFSPDWMTRTSSSEVEEWAKKAGFSRIHLKPLWDDMMEGARNNALKEAEMPLEKKTIKVEEMMCVEWRSIGSSFTKSVTEFGLPIQYLQPHHSHAANLFFHKFEQQPYGGWPIFLLGGSARTEKEVSYFLEEVHRLKPIVAVLVTPVGVELDMEMWNETGIVDSTQYGDVMGSLWQISVVGNFPLRMIKGVGSSPYAKTVGDRYMECGILTTGDERGVVNMKAMQGGTGLEVTVTNPSGEVRMSVNSCVGLISLANIRLPKVKWPKVQNLDGTCREIHQSEKCIVLGNMPWWNEVPMPEKNHH